MNTREYLWWVETIKQNDFRKSLPLNIITWVAFSIFLISLISYFNIQNLPELQNVLSTIIVTSFLMSFISLFSNILLSKKVDKEINEVKLIWENSIEERKKFSNEFKEFFAD